MLYFIIGVIVIHNIKLQFEVDRMKMVVRGMLELMSEDDD
jgi:hypothetical protein